MLGMHDWEAKSLWSLPEIYFLYNSEMILSIDFGCKSDGAMRLHRLWYENN